MDDPDSPTTPLGFLSENAQFAEDLHHSGILFIGPMPETLIEFGLKHRARELAVKANVPIVPGTEIISTVEEATESARLLGYPVRILISPLARLAFTHFQSS